MFDEAWRVTLGVFDGMVFVEKGMMAPMELIRLLADDSELPVRAGVAWNSSAPAEVLGRLADDPAEWVRRGVGQNPSAPVEVLTRLAEDSDSDVRRLVAGNSSAPAEVLGRLADDPEKSVRESVAGNSSTPEEALARIQVTETRLKQAQDQSTDPSRLTELADSQDPSLQMLVAGNPSTPPETLARLAADSNGDVRRRALLNPACPNEVREASGLVFLFTIFENQCSGDTETFPLSEHEIARDLTAVDRFPTSGDDTDYEILKAIFGWPVPDGDGGYQQKDEVLTWAGTGAPDWWSADWDWGQLQAGPSSSSVEEALNCNIGALFDEAMGMPGEGDDENVEGMAISVAFSGRESSQQAWARFGEDIKSAVGDSTEQ